MMVGVDILKMSTLLSNYHVSLQKKKVNILKFEAKIRDALKVKLK